MKDIINGESYKLKNRRKHKIALEISVLSIAMYCIYFLLYQNISVTDFILNYLQKIYTVIIALAVIYNYFFQEEYQYDTQKNLIWIMRDRKSIFLGKFIMQLVILTINYLAIGLVLLLFASIKANDFSEIKALLMIIVGLFFVLIRAVILFDLFTIVWKNDYITFSLYFVTINILGVVIGFLESFLKIGDTLSLYTIQGQLSDVFVTVFEGEEFGISIGINILLSLLGLCVCLVLYKRNK